MRVGLLYPSWTKAYGLFGYFARRNSHWPPLNLALLGAVIKKAGHDAFVIDGQPDDLSDEEMVRQALAQKPDIIGLTSYSPFFHIQVRLAEQIKRVAPHIPVMIGGSHATIVKEKALLPCFDYVFVGESEEILGEFLDALEADGDVSKVKGIIYRKPDGAPHFTGVAPPTKDFDALPQPDHDLLDMSKYRLGTLRGRLPFTSIQTTRGCPWQCIFCASEALNTTRILRRSPESVVDEMEKVVKKYGIRHFYIVDDVMTLYKEHIIKIADLIKAKNLDVTFEGSTRANLVDDPTIKHLAEAGLIRLSFGLETVDSEMRKTMNKKVPLEYYVKANRILNKYNVEALNSVMIGLPGESRESVRKLLRFLRENRDVKQANLAIAVPYPGTELYEMARQGDHGLTLHTDDYSKYRRYGAAVTTVGDLTPKDLVELQNEGFVSIYIVPWRWRPMFGKHGVMGFILLGVRIYNMYKWRLTRWLSETFSVGNLATAEVAQGHRGHPKAPNG